MRAETNAPQPAKRIETTSAAGSAYRKPATESSRPTQPYLTG